jgi:hypothetical protein
MLDPRVSILQEWMVQGRCCTNSSARMVQKTSVSFIGNVRHSIRSQCMRVVIVNWNGRRQRLRKIGILGLQRLREYISWRRLLVSVILKPALTNLFLLRTKLNW